MSPSAFGIRAARAEDAEALASLLGELGYPTDPREAAPRLEPLLRGDGEGAIVADRDGELIGLATYQVTHLIYRPLPQCRLTALVVASRYRRHGIARKLVAAVESIAVAGGCFRLEVTTQPAREDAVALYQALGFEPRPLRLVKRLDPRADARTPGSA